MSELRQTFLNTWLSEREDSVVMKRAGGKREALFFMIGMPAKEASRAVELFCE